MSDRCEMPYSDERINGKQIGDFLGHDDADVGAGAALQERVDVFAEAEFISARGCQVAETVDGDSGGAGAVHGVQQVIDPFVKIQIDGAAVHELDTRIVQ